MAGGKRSERMRINVSVTPDLRAHVLRLGGMMGLSESAAARYLMVRGLESLMGLMVANQSAESLKGMLHAFEAESEAGGAVNRVPVTPGLRDKNVRVIGVQKSGKDRRR